MKKQFRLAIFASGSGSNAEAMIKYFKNHPQISVVCICYNRKNARVKLKAENLGIETQYISNDWINISDKWLAYLESKSVNFIVLAGFLKLVPKKILKTYEDNIINIHPALLPKFGGKGMYGMHVHESVVKHQENETGITIHLVNENYDEGRIIFQKSVKIDENDDANSVADKVRRLEHQYFSKVVENYLLRRARY